MGLRTPHTIDVTCLTDARKREVVASYDTEPLRVGLLSRNESRLLLSKPCSYCGGEARWAQHECRSCGAPIQWAAAPTPPEDDCASGDEP